MDGQQGTVAETGPWDCWTSTQLSGSDTNPEHWVADEELGGKAAVAGVALRPPGCGRSALEEAFRPLPIDTRIRLVSGLASGNANDGKQSGLAAARLSCKALRRVIDDGLLQSLRLNVLPGAEQGPAPSLSHFPNVTRLTLSIDAEWREPKAEASCSNSFNLLPGEQPKPRVRFWSSDYAYPPALLLEPLQGQPLASMHRLQTLTLVGQLASFTSLCSQLCAVFGAAPCGASTNPSTSHSASVDEASDIDPDDASDEMETGGEPSTSDGNTTSSGSVVSREPTPSDSASGADEAGATGAHPWALAYLNLSNVRFPLKSAAAGLVARGHAALGSLGLRELALGAELLPGIEAHKELRRLHIHASTDPAGFVRFKCLSGLDVGILGNGWHEDICDVLKALPHTVTSVCVAGKHRAALCLGKDSSWQATRELVIGEPTGKLYCGGTAKALCRWRRALPRSARITLVKLLRDVMVDGPLRELLDRAERVECDSVVIPAFRVAEALPCLRPAVPRKVQLTLPTRNPWMPPHLLLVPGRAWWEMRDLGVEMVVGDRGQGSGSSGGAAADPGMAPNPVPALDDLLARAVGMIEARANEWSAERGQADGEGEVQDDESDGGSDEEEGGSEGDADESDGDEEEGMCGFEHWWWEGVCSKVGPSGHGGLVLLLAGPGVLALAAHRMAEGAAALEDALGELSQARPGSGKYMVLPGGWGVLLCWDGEEEGLAETAAEAVRVAAAAALRREVPAGDVRAVALPHEQLEGASWGVEMAVVQLLQSEVRLSGDCAELVEQLQAVETLWDKLQQQWLSSRRCSAKYVVAKRQDKDKAQSRVTHAPSAEGEAATAAAATSAPAAAVATRTRAAAAAAAARTMAPPARTRAAVAAASAAAAAARSGAGSAGLGGSRGGGRGGSSGARDGGGGAAEMDGAQQRASKRRRA